MVCEKVTLLMLWTWRGLEQALILGYSHKRLVLDIMNCPIPINIKKFNFLLFFCSLPFPENGFCQNFNLKAPYLLVYFIAGDLQFIEYTPMILTPFPFPYPGL